MNTDTDALLVRYLRELSVPGSPGDQAADTIERLTRERDEAVADAARYRWLRDCSSTPDWEDIGQMTPTQTDKEVDKRMKSTRR